MIDLKRNKSILKIEEIFYNENKTVNSEADIVLLKQSKFPFKGSKEFITLHIDLGLDLEEIESEFKKNTRYEIRRAENKDNLDFKSIIPKSMADIKDFIEFYNSFADSKGLKHCNYKLIERLVNTESIVITYIKNEELLTVHYYISDGNRARLLYSASQFRNVEDNATRNLIGRANRFLHREDIRFFKENNFKILDLGGIAENEDNQATKQIDSFKKSFGGSRVVEYTGKYSNSLLGKIALKVSK